MTDRKPARSIIPAANVFAEMVRSVSAVPLHCPNCQKSAHMLRVDSGVDPNGKRLGAYRCPNCQNVDWWIEE
jgi:hypothetical protein